MTTMEGAAFPTWDTADLLRKALRHAGVGVGEMAEYLGVERNTVGRYINGRTTPDVRTLRLWAMRCGVPYESLCTVTTAQPTTHRLAA
jgi:transcriptional regulator with XRE-family HTH domain